MTPTEAPTADLIAQAREARTHELKTWPSPFQAVIDGRKLHEIRTNDRNFAEGDILHLREWDPDVWLYTGRETHVRVTYITPGGDWGVPDNKCVMSIAILKARETPQ